MSVGHISIFLPRDTDFYRGLLAQMRRGFEELGVTTSGALRHLGADEMHDWCGAHRPDVVFEMNRPRRDAPFLPHDVRHICWLVDFNGRPLEHFEGSDITYLFGVTWPECYPHKGFSRWFGPGACPLDYPAVSREFDVDTSFVGHGPKPWTAAELSRDVTGGRGACSFAELLPGFERRIRQNRDRLRSATDFLHLAQDACAELSSQPLILDEVLQYDVTCRVIRHLNRCDLLDAVLTSESSMALYGPPNWNQWPRYAPYYRGWLSTPEELHRVYVTSAVNLHEGNGIHFRSMDVMSSGGLLMFRETAHDAKHGGIRSMFEPWVHYVPFTLDTLPERLAQCRIDCARAKKIRKEAARAIHAAHTWRHRAQEVLRDLNSL